MDLRKANGNSASANLNPSSVTTADVAAAVSTVGYTVLGTSAFLKFVEFIVCNFTNLGIYRGEQTPADAAIVSLMSKRMADIQRIHNLEDQLREAEARARENQEKSRQRDMNELIKQAESYSISLT